MHTRFSSPKENVLQLGLREGMRVADFGSGTGEYAAAVAGIVGSSGKVYAIDVQEDVLKHFASGIRTHHRAVIETIWGNVEVPGGSHLRDHSLDGVIVSNLLFQAEHREGLITEALRVLKPEGRLLIIDWAGSYGGMGPHRDHVISEHDAENLFINKGFHKVKSFRAGAHHYGIVFTAP